MRFDRDYATACTILIPIIKAGSANFAVSADWTPVAGDVKVIKDGGSSANIGTLPTATTVGNTAMWSFTFTGTEMTAKEILVVISDATTKAVEDQSLYLMTMGASGQYDYNAWADALLKRNVSNVEATAGEHTLATIILAILEYSISGSTWTIKRTNGSTTHATKTLTSVTSGDVISVVT